MPYKVVQHREPQDFCVIYYSFWDSAGCDIFWSEKEIEAEAEAARLNELEPSIESKLCRVLAELTRELKQESETVLSHSDLVTAHFAYNENSRQEWFTADPG